MATFKAIVKGKRKDGFYPVYIRVVHRRKLAYIPRADVHCKGRVHPLFRAAERDIFIKDLLVSDKHR